MGERKINHVWFDLEHGEQIQRVELSPFEIRQAIINGEMQEWRSVGILLGMVLPQLEQEQY